jgi:2-polyprenyl-3-methyl-5-hydroxy-6-metoxy-1,4-benzoquinol methylase
LEKIYPDNYEAYVADFRNDSNRETCQLYHSLSSRLDFVENYIPVRGRLLDIGCATGNFLKLSHERGWTVIGIEPVEKAAKNAREMYHLNVLTTNLENSNLEPASFTAITLWDVLEHLPDVRKAMKIIHELLTSDGMVFFSIPNLESFDRRLFGQDWIGWDPPRHFTLYDQKSITELMDLTGFKIIKQMCLTGGKGAFQLSMDKVLLRRPSWNWIRRFYPIISFLLWPYRRYSYIRLRGPIIYYAATRI